MLENVKHLLRHDKGKTIKTIYESLRDDLNYHVCPPVVLDARYFVPQHRERVFIVGFVSQAMPCRSNCWDIP